MNNKKVRLVSTTLLLASLLLFASAAMYAAYQFEMIGKIKSGLVDPLEAWSEASYIVWKCNSTHYAARNMSTLLAEFGPSTNASQVISNTFGAGRTLFFKNGEFPIDTRLSINENYNNMRLIAESHATILKAANGLDDYILVASGTSARALKNIEISGFTFDLNGAQQTANNPVFMGNSEGMKFINNRIINPYGLAFLLAGDAGDFDDNRYAIIRDNFVNGSGSSGGDLIDFGEAEHSIYENNIAYDTVASSIAHAFAFVKDSSIKNNFAVDSGATTVDFHFEAVKDTVIKDNLSFNNQLYAFEIVQSTLVSPAVDSARITFTSNIANGTVASQRAFYISDTDKAKITNNYFKSTFNLWINGTNHQITNNYMDGMALDFYGTGHTVKHNTGYVTEESGTAEASDNDWISFGVTFAGAPQTILLTVNATDANYFAQVESMNTTHFQLYLYDHDAAGLEATDKTVMWYAEYRP